VTTTPSPGTRRAVIDIGTNSVKLLVADVAGGRVKPVFEGSEQTRLGEGFFETRRLQPAVIAKTAEAVAEFQKLARETGATSLRVIATSAARDATNPAELTEAIERATGLRVEIISGEQEADWVFQGVTSEPELATETLLLLDVGGGSTEFILGAGTHKHFRQSFQLGTVRLLQKLPPADPPTAADLARCRQWVDDFLEREVRPNLEPALRREAGAARIVHSPSAGSGDPAYSGGVLSVVGRVPPRGADPAKHPVQLVGTGGTATILARMEARLPVYDRRRIEATRLSRAQLSGHVERLWSLPLAERKLTAGLPKKRADVILPGAVIYDRVMAAFGFEELRVSTRGLRFAAVMAE
jgi:exopolyphosphatase/guanosine-5'-triphosphate,3'-diphosphate pyrophosphatase